MTFLSRFFIVAALSVSAFAHAQNLNLNQLNVTFDRKSAVYELGEEAKFQIQYLGDLPKEAKLTWSLGPEGMPPSKSGEIAHNKEPLNLSGTMAQPGFLNLKIKGTYQKENIEKVVGVAFSPQKIAPSLPLPDDFDAFWESQKKKLAAIPLNPRIKQVLTLHSKGVICYDVQLDSVGKGASAYFARPSSAKPKSLPVILTLHGAGVRSSQMSSAISWAQRGFLAMDLNAHGLPNGKPESFYKAQADKELLDYRYWNRDNREESYFVKMFLRDLRALQFLCEQPEWDGKTVVVYGTSQGGFQSIATAYLDPRVTFVMAGVPAGCDHSGMKANRVAGWPKIVPYTQPGVPDEKVLQASRYIDNVNFAARTKAKEAFFTVGFIDFVCPPTSVYAAYNALPLEKKNIFHDIPRAHAPSKEAYEAMVSAVLEHVKAQSQSHEGQR